MGGTPALGATSGVRGPTALLPEAPSISPYPYNCPYS